MLYIKDGRRILQEEMNSRINIVQGYNFSRLLLIVEMALMYLPIRD
jgi:hypothetical protein